jgi:hypothetical protein
LSLPLSFKKIDEYYTPPYAVEPLLEFIEPGKTAWCPFDTEDSAYVKGLRNHGCQVIYSHIDKGQDFFSYLPEQHFDCIISNPPFSLKTRVIERLLSLQKPFSVLLNFSGLFESKRFDLLNTHAFELLLFDKRIAFFRNYHDDRPAHNPPFSCVYLSHQLLPERIMFRRLHK